MVLSPCRMPLLWLQQHILEDKLATLEGIYIMGGCEEKGNFNGLEFNQVLDAHSFKEFVELCYDVHHICNIPIFIATLDSCESSALDLYNFDMPWR